MLNFKNKVKLKGQGHRVQNVGIHGKALSQETLICKIKSLALTVQKLFAKLNILKSPRSGSQIVDPFCQNCWYLLVVLISQNTYVKYQSSISHCSKVISKFKVLKKVKLQGQGHRVKNIGTNRNIKALAPTVQKLLPRFSFSKSRSNSKVKIVGTNGNVLSHRILM